MSLFLFSLILAFALHQAGSGLQPQLRRNQQARLGRRWIIRLPAHTYVVWKAGFLAFATVLFLITILIIVASGYHPADGFAVRISDALTSPRIGAAFFGGLVGLLLGHLVNRILRGGKKFEPTKQDRIEIALVIALVLLGIGGEEAIQSMARRVTKVSFGGAEISLSGPARTSASPPQQPGTASAQAGESSSARAQLAATGSSSGLQSLARLDVTIGNDSNYIAILFAPRFPAATNAQQQGTEQNSGPFSGVLRLAGNLAPAAQCLQEIYSRTTNVRALEQHLSNLTELVQQVSTKGTDKIALQRAARRVALGDLLERAIEVRETMPAPAQRDIQVCRQLANIVCGPAEKGEQKELVDRLQIVRDCIRDRPTLEKLYPGDSELDELSSLGSYPSPYLTMAYAGLLAQQREYFFAALTLHNWLQLYGETVHRWYAIRARFELSVYLEEWIRSRGDDTPLSLRQYHIDNWMKIISLMRGIPNLAEVRSHNSDYVVDVGILGAAHSGDDGLCKLTKDDDKLEGDAKKFLSNALDSYISALSYLVDNALKHSTFRREQATVVGGYMKELSKFSLRCIDPDSKNEVRAEILERYTRNHINLVDNSASLRSKDTIRAELNRAIEILNLASQLIARDAKNERDRSKDHPDFQSRIFVSSLIELYDNLSNAKAKLQERERNLASE